MDGRHCAEQFRRSTKRRKAIENQGESIAKGLKTCCTTSSRATMTDESLFEVIEKRRPPKAPWCLKTS
jgi:hypothetical protein